MIRWKIAGREGELMGQEWDDRGKEANGREEPGREVTT